MSEQIVGMGMDLIQPSRIQAVLSRRGESFLRRVYTEEEISYSLRGKNKYQRLAARWAAKEAFLKAVGTELTGISMKDVEVIASGHGPPQIQLHGSAQKRAEKIGVERVLVSLSHSEDVAGATVLLLSA